ncbi:MAG: ABC transporter ATP-binding protein [Pseudomonadota bacterium]|jgi:ABC-2 type transport system ATP-binding protein|nr:ABC transporter ATP-binding protein [Pseudomonadota bacterium]HCI19879.1 multidrug ABC transporter ATP-binding protein [Alphaproteobacteria bacterium]|tara:strand:- start:2031 stop:2951 length:921 start_codon:yes stop_codon:yes gene_type:complete
MAPILSIRDLRKSYGDGAEALKGISLDIEEGEVIALLGPNGAGKTTLISTICGLVRASSGSVTVNGFDIVDDYRKARALIGLVPQEIMLESFQKVKDALHHSRGLFNKPRDPAIVETLLKKLSLWDKRDAQNMTLSGGMRRRVMIGKALSHQPRILFLDEPTAGVDVELRKEMWDIVSELKADGVTIILTTHYIEEAEAIAERVGVINGGELLLVEDKATLMRKMGSKTLRIDLQDAITAIPDALTAYDLKLEPGGETLFYTYDSTEKRTGITRLLADVNDSGLRIRDVATSQSSLEDIFVNMVRD